MVIILRGISGSGKSTLARFMMSNGSTSRVNQLVNSREVTTFMWGLYEDSPAPREHFSTDNYFLMIDGEYRFDGRNLSIAHSLCLKNFAEAVRGDSAAKTLVVDNTNCSIEEVSPYADLAEAYSHKLCIVTLIGDPKTCWERGQHRVPFSSVLRQDMKLRRSLIIWPSKYAQQIFPI